MPKADERRPLEPGLYVVGTPIGNLEDITLRALRVLRSADLVACEDTRQTQKLLQRYSIQTRTISYHEHNEMTRAAELMIDLEQGARIALVADAGTPGISDPGYRLISLAIRHHVPVIPIPGPAAFLAALVAAGLPADSFRFAGFLPARRGARRQALESIREAPRTVIFYEAPHRILETLADAVEALGPARHVVVAREVTKLHEEFLRGRADQVLAELQGRGVPRGEITLLIGRAEEAPAEAAAARLSGKELRRRLDVLMAASKLDQKAALKRLAKETGIGKSQLYRQLQRARP